MKLKYLFPSVLMALSMAFVACGDDDDKKTTDEPQSTTEQETLILSQKLVTINPQGGQVEITISSSDSWTIAPVGKEPTWLHITPTKGEAGDTKVTFAAAEALTDRAADFKVVCGKLSSIVKVEQAGSKTLSTCQEVIEGNDSVVFCVKGKVARIENTLYGNWYLEDETGTIYIYGTLDKEGNAGKNNSIEAWGIEVGDIIMVEGKKLTYNGKVELVNVTVLDIQKGEKEQPAEGHGLSADDPFTVEEALAEAGKLEQDAVSEKDYFVKGKISNIKYTFDVEHGTATFSITEDGNESDKTFLCYGCYYLGNTSWQEGNTQIELGDEVIVCGKFTNYKGTLETKSKMNYIYSLNGKTK